MCVKEAIYGVEGCALPRSYHTHRSCGYNTVLNTYGHNLTQLSASAANLPLRFKRFCVRPLWAGEACQPTLVRHDQPQGVLQVLYLHLVRPRRTYVVNTAAHQGSARTATSRHYQRQRILGAALRIDHNTGLVRRGWPAKGPCSPHRGAPVRSAIGMCVDRYLG